MTQPPEPDAAPTGTTPAARGGPTDGTGHLGVSGLAATVDRLRQELRDAHERADGRGLVDLARGVLVERLRCSPTSAAQQLRTMARQAGLSVLELAADIVDDAAGGRGVGGFSRSVNEADAAAVPADPTLSGDSYTSGPAFHDGPANAGDGDGDAAVRLRVAESGALGADEVQTVADSLLTHALAPLDAVAVAIWAVGPDGSLRLAGSAGFSPAEAERWRYLPPAVATLARQALRERRAVWVEAFGDGHPPSIGNATTTGGGRVVVPARLAGRVLGVLEICWPRPLGPQPPALRRQMEALAELAAHALDDRVAVIPPRATSPLAVMADSLLASAMVLHPLLSADGQLTDFHIHHVNEEFVDLAGRPAHMIVGSSLLEVYPMAAQADGIFDKLVHVCLSGEPFRARRMTMPADIGQVTVDVTADVSIMRHGEELLLVWRNLDKAAHIADLLQHAQRLGRIAAFEQNARTGAVIWSTDLFALCGLPPTAAPIPLERLHDHVHPDDTAAVESLVRSLLDQQRPATATFRLVRPDGAARHIRVIAEPVLDDDTRLLGVRGAYQDISAQHWTEVALAATRGQLAHTEEEAAANNRLALQLQRAIMPEAHEPLDAFGLRVAVRYRPAGKDHLVGGDWYDAVLLPSKQVLVTVGDVAGHGIDAATGMVVLRNALRGLAMTGAGPAQMLTWLNDVACHLNDYLSATAVCALYDPVTHTMRWARAGHLPPILVRNGRAEALPTIRGIILGGFSDADYTEDEITLDPGDTLLLYTDGLIERRDRSMEHSVADLVAEAQRGGATIDDRLDRLLAQSPSDTDDDTCLVAVHVTT